MFPQVLWVVFPPAVDSVFTYMHKSVFSSKHEEHPLPIFRDLFVCSSHLCYSSLSPLATLISLVSVLSLQLRKIPESPLSIPRSVFLNELILGNHMTHHICFLSLGDHYPLLPLSSIMKTICILG